MINLPPMTSLILDQIRPFGKVTEVRSGLSAQFRFAVVPPSPLLPRTCEVHYAATSSPGPHLFAQPTPMHSLLLRLALVL
jgi:hypothetical protein